MALIDGLGLWCDIAGRGFAGRAALFVDRDGVIIEDVSYLGRAADVRMLPGAAAAIGHCNRLGIPVVLVTNQSGIGRGYYQWRDFEAVQAAISTALAADEAHLDAVLACAFHGEAAGPYRVADHAWRKPRSGMLLAAAEHMQVNLQHSWIVGDRAADLAAGKAAALRGGVLVAADEGGERAAALQLADGHFTVRLSRTLAEAVAIAIAGGLASDRRKG